MKILMVSPEIAPKAKVGGLADVVAALPKELVKLGHEVSIICPKYGFWEIDDTWHPHPNPMPVNLGYGRTEYCQLWETQFEGTKVKLFLIEYDKYYHRHEIYTGPWGSYSDNNERFAFLSRAAIDLCYYLNWTPDVIHCHDWTTGFVPLYLNTTEWHTPLAKTATIFTIHNMAHQGIFGRDIIRFAGLPESTFRTDCLEALGSVNIMKGALFNSTKITTVSPNYAKEIQTAEFGCGLDPVLKYRAADLIGVINGVDKDSWNPETDPHITKNFSKKDTAGKKLCKLALQEELNLTKDPNILLLGVVSRLYDQKGLDLLLNIIPKLMDTMHVQVALLGAGDPGLESGFNQMAARYPGRVGVYIGYREPLAHAIEAGSDCFLMPSRFEPCGMNQMYSMTYGTLPIARATGGLSDTIQQYQEGKGQGTGFLFEHANESALYYTIGWACSTYYDRPKEFAQLQHNAMSADFSWNASAKKYIQVYQWAIETRAKRN